MVDWCERRRLLAAVALNLAVGLFAIGFFAAIVADIVVDAYTAPSEVYAAGMAVLAGLAGATVAGGRSD